MELRDISNWQLGQYIKVAVCDAVSAFGKKVLNNYPKEPDFYAKIRKEETNNLSEQENQELKELQLMKVMAYLERGNNLIKPINNKGGVKNG